MEISKLPTTLDGWKLDLIYEICNYTDIESENFDVKLEPHKIHEDICAMANTDNGFILLGIDEKKDGEKIIEFIPKGFELGKEDSLRNKIGNAVVNVEPQPNVQIKHIIDKKKGVFYSVIQINGKNSDKPYFVKDTIQCYIRIQSSSRKVGRSVILNLYSATMEEKKNLQNLKTACGLVKEAMRFTIRQSYQVTPSSTMKISPLDLSFLRNAILSCENFLKKHDLWGGHTSQGSYTHGVNSLLHELEMLNIYVKSYNESHNQDEKTSLKSQLYSYSLGSSFEESTIEMFNKIISNIDNFLKR